MQLSCRSLLLAATLGALVVSAIAFVTPSSAQDPAAAGEAPTLAEPPGTPAAPPALAEAERALEENRFRDAAARFAEVAAEPDLASRLRARAKRGEAVARDARGDVRQAVQALIDAVLADPKHPGAAVLLHRVASLTNEHGGADQVVARFDAIERAVEEQPSLAWDVDCLRMYAADMKGRLDDVMQAVDAMRPVREVLLLGPFDNSGGSGIDEVYPPEEAIDLSASYVDRRGRSIRWLPVEPSTYGHIDIDAFTDNEPEAVVYALTHLRVASDTPAIVHLAGSGAARIWVNGELVLDEHEVRTESYHLYETPIELHAGWNQLLVKKAAELEQLNLYVHLTDAQYRRLDYEISREPPSGFDSPSPGSQDAREPDESQGPQVPPGAPPRGLERFPRQSWAQRWAPTEGTPLADAVLYSRTLLERQFLDEAETVIESAAARFPRSGLIEELRGDLVAAQEEGHAMTAWRRAAELAPELLSVRLVIVQEYIQQNELDAAWEELEKLRSEFQDNVALAAMQGFVRMARGDVAEGFDEVRTAFRREPDNRAINGMFRMLLSLQQEGAMEEQGVLEAFAARPGSPSLAREAAAFAHERQDYEQAMEHLEHALIVGAPPCLVCAEMMTVWEAADRRTEAIEAGVRGLDWCPQNADLHQSIGVAYLKEGKKSEGLEYLRRALALEPAEIELRELIRRAEGRPPLHEYFERTELEDVMAADLSWMESDAAAVVLLDESEYTLFDDGVTQHRWHYVVKVLTQGGVSGFRTFPVPGPGSGDVEIARLVKPDGRRIDAERGSGEVTFQELEPGDVIETRISSSARPSAGFGNHFWHDNSFQSSVPCLIGRYSLLSPEDADFEVRLHNVDVKPRVSTDEGWRLTVWEVRRLPGDPFEINSPPDYERTAWIDVSSIESWETLVKWYDAESRGRLRSTPRVRTLAAELGADASTDRERVERVSDYVRETIDYEGGQFIESPTVPRAADVVCRTRYGDCKDQSGLIIALLREMGVEAHFALVNSRHETTVPYLPSPRFSHAIVQARTGDGDVYWIDPTEKGLRFPNVPIYLEGAEALLIDPEARKQFVRIPIEPPSTNGTRSTLRGTVGADGVLEVEGRCEFVGEDAASYRDLMRIMPEEKDKVITEMLAEEHPGATVEEVEVDLGDATSDHVTLRYRLNHDASISHAGKLLIVEIPWTMNVTPQWLVNLEERETPLVLDDWKGEYHERVELQLPAGYGLVAEPPSAQHRLQGVGSFELSGTHRAGEPLVLERRLVIEALRVETEDYAEFREFLNKAAAAEKEALVLEGAAEP